MITSLQTSIDLQRGYTYCKYCKANKFTGSTSSNAVKLQNRACLQSGMIRTVMH